MNIPFDVSYHFDENLHDVPNSPSQMQQAVNFLQLKFNNSVGDIGQQIHLAGLIGAYARMLHDFDTAQKALNTALKLCDREAYQKDDFVEYGRLRIVNSIRLAHLSQWQQQYEQSEALFDWVLEQCLTNCEFESYLDFAYQHFGKCKFDRAKYKQAQHCFTKALEIRYQTSDRLFIDSTQLALELVQKRRDKSNNYAKGKHRVTNSTANPKRLRSRCRSFDRGFLS